MRVLTVDDSSTILAMLHHTLSNAGFEVLQAEDGQQGLDVLKNESVDVVITDINMPIMDGIEFIKNVRAIGHAPEPADPDPHHRDQPGQARPGQAPPAAPAGSSSRSIRKS